MQVIGPWLMKKHVTRPKTMPLRHCNTCRNSSHPGRLQYIHHFKWSIWWHIIWWSILLARVITMHTQPRKCFGAYLGSKATSPVGSRRTSYRREASPCSWSAGIADQVGSLPLAIYCGFKGTEAQTTSRWLCLIENQGLYLCSPHSSDWWLSHASSWSCQKIWTITFIPQEKAFVLICASLWARTTE